MYKISTADWKMIETEAIYYVSQYVERSKFELFKTKLRGLILETLERLKQKNSEDISAQIRINMRHKIVCSLNEHYR